MEVSVKPYYGKGEVFVPPEQPPLEFELTPTEEAAPEQQPETLPFTPATYEFPPIKPVTPVKKPLVVNVETTGVSPVDSRVISIGVKDPSTPDARPMVLIDEDEKRLVEAFFDFYESQGYDTLIGYNIGFDYRFLFVEAMKFRYPAPGFTGSDLYDVMTQMKQVRQKFTPGFNKPGTLDEWAKLLLGLEPKNTQAEVLEAWANKKFEIITEYQEYKVEAAFELWALAQGVFGKAELEETTPATVPEEHSSEATKVVHCSNCGQEHIIPASADEFTCKVCGQKNQVEVL